MQQFENAVIVGVGLLGGSIGLALRHRGIARRIVGVGRHAPSLSQAIELQAITEMSLDLQHACHGADLIVVCTPVQAIPAVVTQCLNSSLASNCLLTDVGSTKVGICEKLEDAVHRRFCGAHPIAGSDRSGVSHARADLFEGRMAIVTPTPQTPDSLVAQAENFWQLLGCRTMSMTPEAHDRVMARVSHLPHLIAAALAAATDRHFLPFVGTGWEDTTRIAAGNVEMWQQIIAENQQPILDALRDYSECLEQWIEAIESNDFQMLSELLQIGKSQRDSISE